MPTEIRESRVQSGDWRTVATLWNTTATGIFRSPPGAQIKVRYGGGWPFGKDRQKQTLDGSSDKYLRVGKWSVTVARMQVKVRETAVVQWTYGVEGPGNGGPYPPA